MFNFNQSKGPSPVAASAGKKRFAASDSSHENTDSVFQSKRILAGSAFDIHRAEPSQQQSVEPPLDSHRASLSRQHVRALNNQFASWVQTQLLNHPDELWEDGVQDYIAHASEIKVKFSDVVKWLKANAAKGQSVGPLGSFSEPNTLFSASKDNGTKGQSVGPLGSFSEQNKLFSASKDNGTKLVTETPLFSQGEKAASFLPSWSSGAPKGQSPFSFGSQTATVSNNGVTNQADGGQTKNASFFSGAPKSQNSFSFGSQNTTLASNGLSKSADGGESKKTSLISGAMNSPNSFSFGSQNATLSNNVVSNDADGEEELEQPSSPSVKKTEEKGIIVVHEVKCKIYVKSSDPADKDAWKDKGTGQLSIKCKEGVEKGTRESKPTILVRNDVGRLLLNALIYPGIKTSLQKNSVVSIFHTAGDGGNDGTDSEVVARTFLIRTKTEEDRNKLAAAIKEYTPSS